MKTFCAKAVIACLIAGFVSCPRGVASQAANGETRNPGPVLTWSFSSNDALAGWETEGDGTVSVTPGYQGVPALCVQRVAAAPVSSAGSTYVETPLPLKDVAGRRLIVHALIRASGVADPPHPWNGVKLMLVVVSPTGTDYPACGNLKGTFAWQDDGFTTNVPADATSVKLVLGIEATTGSVWYSDLAVRIADPLVAFRLPPAPAEQRIYNGHPGIDRLRGAMVSTDVSPADLDVLGGRWGANLIRFQISEMSPHPEWIGPTGIDLDAYDRWLRGRLDHLDSLLPACRRNGIRVVVDLHTPPGGEYGSDRWQLFLQRRLQDRFLAIWDKIARRYRDSDVVWGYDLCNEPADGDVADGLMDWQHLAEKTALLVRSIDTRHAIIVEPYAGEPEMLKYLKPLPVSGVVYSVHMYAPSAFTMQSLDAVQPAIPYPGIVDGVQWNRDTMADYLCDVRKFQLRYRVAIYVGEFSSIRWAPGDSSEQYLRDAIALFEKYGWDWSYHAFREWQGWSTEYGGDRNATAPETAPTGRQLLLRSWYAKNSKWLTRNSTRPGAVTKIASR